MCASEQRVGIVCVLYYKEYIDPTLRALDKVRARIGPSHTVLVLNGSGVLPELDRIATSSTRTEILLHDNWGAEFGGYQVGLERLGAGNRYPWVIFANDTFSTHGHFGGTDRKRFVAEFTFDKKHPTIVGRVESLNRSFKLAGHQSHRWVTTNIFAVNCAALEELRHQVYDPALESLIVDTADPEAFFASDVSPVLRSHVASWLFGNEIGYPTWYAASPLTSANAAKMARKARAILQEMHLSASLEASGAEFIDLKNMTTREKMLTRLERIANLSLHGRRRNEEKGQA